MKGAVGQMPSTPFEPPVRASHWNTIAHTICAKASVSIARYTPESRTANQPKIAAASAATSGAAAIAPTMGKPASLKSSPAP